MATKLPIYETERGNEGGDVKAIPEVSDLNTVIDRVNALADLQTPPVAASLVTGIVGNKNAILWTAKQAGEVGNEISVAIVIPAGAGAVIAVSVDGKVITVHGATAGAGVSNSSAADVEAAILGTPAAAALVTAVDDSTSDGTGKVAASGRAPLANGADGAGLTYLPPVVAE